MDLIDRNALLNRYQEICNGTACMDCPFNKDGCAFEKLILESAVVDAKPIRHGKWYWDNYFYDWTCSECHKCADHCPNKEDAYAKPNFDYCPHCGAKMDGEGAET